MNFTPEGQAALAKIHQCMTDAQEAFATLNADENRACFEFHNEASSLNHCIRWGAQAAEELVEASAATYGSHPASPTP